MESARVFFQNYSKCILDLNKVNKSHNCHGLKRVAQSRVSNGVERVPFRKLQTSPWGCVLQSEPPGTCPHCFLYMTSALSIAHHDQSAGHMQVWRETVKPSLQTHTKLR